MRGLDILAMVGKDRSIDNLKLFLKRKQVFGTFFIILMFFSLLPFVVSDTVLPPDSDEQEYPDIYENIVVWQDDGGSDWDILGYDFETDTQFTICDAAGDQKYPKISGNYVVWEDYRNDVNHPDVYGYNLSTGTEFAICTANSDQNTPDVSGNMVAWVDYRDWGGAGHADIYVYYINTSTEVNIYTSSNAMFNSCIDGDKIAWQEMISGNYVIKVYDISEDTTDTFTGSGGSQVTPALSGDIVVWSDHTYNYKIKGYDFSTSTYLDICADVTDSAESPCIDGNLVAWNDFRNGSISDIYGYDLDTSTEFAIIVDPSSQTGPSISKGVVVWEDWRTGNYDIHYSRIGSDEWGPNTTIDDVSPDPSNNSVNVTVTASVSDASEGMGNIVAAEYFIGTVGAPGTGTPMNASDGTFDSMNEGVTVDIDVSARSTGNYTVYVRGQDEDGNWSVVDDHQFYVNNDYSGPWVTNALINPDPARCQTTVELTAGITDNANGGSVVAGAEYSIDGEIVTHGTGTAMDPDDGNFDSPTEQVCATVDISALDAGAHTVYVYGVDAYGNWGDADTYEFTVILDCEGPVTSGGSVTPDPALNETSVTINATVDDTTKGNSNISEAEYFVGAIGTDGEGTSMISSDGVFDETSEDVTATLDITGWTTGSYSVFVHGKDQYGNWGTSHEITFDVSVDYDAPVVTDLEVSPDPARCSATVSVSATVDDFSTGGHDIVEAECSLDAEIVTHGTGTPMQPFDGNFDSHSEQVVADVNTSSLSSGDHTIYVYGKDSYGNWSDYASYTFTYIDDCTGPVTSDLALDPNPAQNNEFTELTGTVDDSTTGGSGIKAAEYFIDAPGTNGTGTPMNAFSPPFSAVNEPIVVHIDAMALGSGLHTIYVHGKDQYDNWGDYVTINLEVISSGEIQLTDEDHNQYNCAIYNKLVVYSDDRYDVPDSDNYYNYDIFLYNIGTSQEVRITDDSMQQWQADIFDDIIVWTDLRNDTNEDYTNYDIYGCYSGADALFGTVDDVEFQVTSNVYRQEYPTLYGDLIVWQDNRNGDYDIYGCYPGPDNVFGTADDVEFRLTPGSSNQASPAIYDGVIVWTDDISGAFDNDIHGCYPGVDNIFGTGDDQFFIVDSNTYNQTFPDVYGNNIVWQDKRNGALGDYGNNWDIYGANTGADGLFGTGDDVVFQMTTNTIRQQYPEINGRFIVWEDNRHDATSDAEIYIYDLGEDCLFGTADDTAEYRITRDGSRKEDPHVSQYYAVWIDSRNGDTDVYAYQTGAGGGGSLDVDATSHSIVSNGVSTVTVNATVVDDNSDPVPNGTQVAFSTTAGSLSASITTTTGGVATVTLTSSSNVETAKVTASAMGESDTTIVFFTSSDTDVESINTQTVTNGTMDVKTEAGTEVDVTGTAEVTVAKYTDNPGSGFAGGSLGEYIDIYVPDTSAAAEIEIRLYYTDEDVAGLDEATLRMDYWDGTAWVECSLTDVNVGENYIWARFNATSHPSLTELQATAFGGEGVETFLDIDIALLSNWNLVSFSHIPSDTTLDSVMDSYPEVDYVYRWNPDTDAYEYSHYIETLGWKGDFSEIDRTNGFWFHCTSDPAEDLELYGIPDGPVQIGLKADWNLVSWQKTSSQSIADALGDIAQYVDYIYRWNPDTDAYEYSHYIETLGWKGDFDTLDPDYGYWFHCLENCTWDLT